MYYPILSIGQMERLVGMLSEEEAAELEAYLVAGVDPAWPDKRRSLVYVVLASDWLTRWRASQCGGMG